ncbi:MAG: OprO/OprP family phosphate-selective porin [Candidatus Gastranaerophilales bacterium]|nr:OprO/OprP family phosphate-selective porin [Candidatus Gastranaerophilales bacterium]MCM1072499.1 OprO/OprP family phosphate-selective porin [Bacteroides sp.]
MIFLRIACLFLILFMPVAYGIEEVELDLKEEKKIEAIKTLREVDTQSQTSYLFEEVLTKHFDKSPIESAHLFGYYRAAFDMDINSDDEDFTYGFSSMSTGIDGDFKDGKTHYEMRFRFNPKHDCSFLQYLPSNMYIANTAIPHHTVVVGHTRTPTGYEGGKSLTTLPFYAYSQISRNFGNVRKVGARVKGNYSYIDYDLGGYSSDVYFTSFFPGAEFAGWANVKPFGGKNKEKLGVLKLGGGITSGQRHGDYFVSGAYAGYERQKFSVDFEWAKADGYNGGKGYSSNKAEGFYTTVGYKVTPKTQLVARYDQFKPNLDKSTVKREYSAGVNYLIKGQTLKLMLNYIYCQNNTAKDSHKILLGTQILL